MSEILLVQRFFEVAKWVYDQLSTMKENRAEAQALAERVHRLSDVALALKTHLQPGLVQLSPEIRACLTHVEEYFAELDSMLAAHSQSINLDIIVWLPADCCPFLGQGNIFEHKAIHTENQLRHSNVLKL